MANNKLFGIKSAYILLLALMVSALCLPAVVSADLGEPDLFFEWRIEQLPPGSSGTATLTISEKGGYDSAQDLQVTMSSDVKGVSFGNPQTIVLLKPGASQTLTFPVKVDSSVQPGKYSGKISYKYTETGAMGIGTYSHSKSGPFQFTVYSVPKVSCSIDRFSLLPGQSDTGTLWVSANGGEIPAENIVITLFTDTPGVTFGKVETMPRLPAGFTVPVKFTVYTTSSVQPGIYTGTIKYDYNGQSGTDTFEYEIKAPNAAESVFMAAGVPVNSSNSFTAVFLVAFLILFVICVWAVHRSNKKRREDERREWERREWERRNNGRPEWDNRNMNSQEWWESNDRDRRQYR